MMDCQAFSELASSVSVVVECSSLQDGLLRIKTVFRYPDGSHIDLFLKEQDHLLNTYVVSDLGETTAYLLELNIRPWKTEKRKATISKICKTLGVSQEGAELQVALAGYEQASLGDALVRLAQACIRVSDIALSYTMRTVSAFREDVEEFLESTGFRYEVDVPVKGQHGNMFTVDFSVEGPRQVSLIQTLAAANSIVGGHMADAMFAKWYDIRFMRTNRQFLTVFDSQTNVFDESDLRRLGDLSLLVGFPDEREELRNALAA